ncbi:helix-turn-helix transcriptional regulator [Adlercreutzia sp. ZJ304]|uniref:helix-turn-helix domain-containing protein n=1 Tax=Adlercreutzia sp. ZJ304 TaxID=2709791 RepID=UPI0013EAE7E0|nr:helix-turn-helix transcriptional regulator [Adlercreutzia sp. ZJ304]
MEHVSIEATIGMHNKHNKIIWYGYIYLINHRNIKINIMERNARDWETTLGQRLKRYRLDMNMTQDEVASRSGLTQATIAKLERGVGSRLLTFIKVMKVLGIEEQLDLIAPATPISPIQLRQYGKQRKRARSKGAQGNTKVE